MSSVFVNARACSRKDAQESSKVEMEIFINLYFDGVTNAGAQMSLRDQFRQSGNFRIDDASRGSNILHSYCSNPNATKSPNRNVKNELVKHLDFHIVLQPYGCEKNNYITQLIRTKNLIDNEIQKYVIDSNVETIKLYFNIIGYAQGEFVSNIVNSIGIYNNDEELKNLLGQLFNFKDFFKNRKIKEKVVESINSFELAGYVDSFNNAGFAKVATSISDANVCKQNISSKDYPSEDKISIYDAVVMCQHTYESEDAADKNIFAIIKHVIFGSEEKKASKDTERVSIAVDEDIYKNVRNSSYSRTKTNSSETTDNWITTDAEWISVASNDPVIKNCDVEPINRLKGFYSKLYKRVENGKTISYAYCTAGTDPGSFNDWVFANFLQGLTGISLQYTQSVRNAKKLDSYFGSKYPLFFIGHSLGGGLASNNALVTKSRHAITFNAAGLNPFRIFATLLINNRGDLFNRESRKNRVHPFIIDGEAVQFLRFIGQPAMSADSIFDPVKGRETRFYDDTEIVKSGGDPRFGDMGSFEKHNVINFLRIKDLDKLRIN